MKTNLDFKKVETTAFNTSALAFDYIVDEVQNLLDSNPDVVNSIQPLAKFIIDRSATVALLTQQRKLWDAEIIFRAILEVLSKFLIITTQENENDLNKKLDEYWSQISDMERLRYSKVVENIVEGGNIYDADKFKETILTDEERTELESKVPKAKQQVLSNDWSFNVIVRELYKNPKLNPLVSKEVLHFFWKMSSHVAHGDKVGLNAIRLRLLIEEGKEFRDTTQYLKLIKGVTTSCYWVAAQLASFVKDTKKNEEILEAFSKTNNELTAIHIVVADEARRCGID